MGAIASKQYKSDQMKNPRFMIEDFIMPLEAVDLDEGFLKMIHTGCTGFDFSSASLRLDRVESECSGGNRRRMP